MPSRTNCPTAWLVPAAQVGMAKELPPPDGVEQLPSPRRYVLAEGVPVALAIMTSPVRVTGVVGAVPPVPVTYT